MNIRRAIAFTGHRPESLPFGENEQNAQGILLKAMLLTEIIDRASKGYDTFYCGAARGSDILFGEQVIWVKATMYPAIRLICVVPHEEQARGWSESWRERYFDLLEHASDEVLISAHYTRDCYHRRNRYMVDHADALLAVYNGSHTGGTAYTVAYAWKKAKDIVLINPDTIERSVILPRLGAI